MLGSVGTKLGVLGKCIITHDAVVFLCYPTGVGSSPTRFQPFRIIISQYFCSLDAAMISSTDTKLMGLYKYIITHNISAFIGHT